MKYDPQKHHRRSVRLKGYDYTQEGAYVVTVCTHQRECLFGAINVDGVMTINTWGEIAAECWNAIPEHFPHTELDAFIVMPNHIHGIVLIVDAPKSSDMGNLVGEKDGERGHDTVGVWHAKPLPTMPAYGKPIRGALGTIVGAFKSAATKRINQIRDTPQAPLWQRNFYDNIIQHEQMLNQFRFYIENNPSQWAADRYHPE